MSSNNIYDSSFAIANNMITVTFTSSETLFGANVILYGISVNATNTQGNSWSASITLTGLESSSNPLLISYSDLAGNVGTNVNATTNNIFVTLGNTFLILYYNNCIIIK